MGWFRRMNLFNHEEETRGIQMENHPGYTFLRVKGVRIKSKDLRRLAGETYRQFQDDERIKYLLRGETDEAKKLKPYQREEEEGELEASFIPTDGEDGQEDQKDQGEPNRTKYVATKGELQLITSQGKFSAALRDRTDGHALLYAYAEGSFIFVNRIHESIRGMAGYKV